MDMDDYSGAYLGEGVGSARPPGDQGAPKKGGKKRKKETKKRKKEKKKKGKRKKKEKERKKKGRKRGNREKNYAIGT